MSENGKGNAEDIIEFDTLDLDEDTSGSNTITELQSFLKESLKPDKYSEAMKILGISDDMSNVELLEAVTLLLKKKDEEEEEEEEEKKAAKKKAEEDEEEEEEKKASEKVAELEEEEEKAAGPSYKDFMDKCMKAGKSMGECAKEYKEKYPAPKKEEESEVEQLAESEWKDEIELAKKKKKDEYEYPEKKASELAPELRKEFDELKEKASELSKVRNELDELKEKASELSKVREELDELREKASELSKGREELDELKLELTRLKEERRLAEIAQRVDEQIDEKHLAPKQRDHVIKLMAKLPETYHDELLSTFATQKFRGFEDVGQTDVRRPGELPELDEGTRMRLLKEHGIDDLIFEKGTKRRAS